MQKDEKLDKLYWKKKALEQRKLELDIEKSVLLLESKKLKNKNGREKGKLEPDQEIYREDYGLHIS